MSATDRIVILVDMDCFYCQVEQKLDPSLVGKPLAVVQYNTWKGGGLIAVNYEARARGVTRHMRGDDARAKCPEIELAKVPAVRGKADLTRYREAGKQVAEVLQTFTSLLERASVDEAYLDITDSVNERLEMCIKPEQLSNSHVVGFDSVADFLREMNCDRSLHDSNVKLAIGGVITEEIRAAVYEKTGYRCSAGVAHNKILAKLTAGLHKPNKQTILPHESVAKLYETISVKKIPSMGGKFGDEVMQKLNVNMMVDLIKFSEKELQQHFEEKTANWLFNLARGINRDPVVVRLVSKSIGCCKRFAGRGALVTEKDVRHWMSELAAEIAERIEKDIAENNRKPKQLIVSYSQRVGKKEVASTRSHALNTIEQAKIYQESYEIVKKNCQKSDASFSLTFLGLNVSKFEEIKNVAEITSFFKSAPKHAPKITDELVKLSKEIDAVVRQNIELNKSFGESSGIKKITNVATASKCSDLAADDDDSEAELEAISSSVTSVVSEANTPVSLKEKRSFFHNFLNTAKAPRRDFNTSAILDTVPNEEVNKVENESSTRVETNENNLKETQSCSIESNTIRSQAQIQKQTILSMFSGNNPKSQQITDDNKELCPECSKLIPVEDIMSHTDYHFAIRIVRDEAHLYKEQEVVSSIETNETKEKAKSNVTTSVNNSKGTKKKSINNNNSRKRKSSHPDVEITNFLKPRHESVTDENSEVCPDCCKRIKLDEFASHRDYHVARKLHQEINTMSELSANGAQKSGKSTGNAKGSIAAYFKKL